MYTFLKKAKPKPNSPGIHILSDDVSKQSFFYAHRNTEVPSSTLETLLTVADGFRLSTVRTILSGPDGTAAAHEGSGLKTTGQPAAHNLVRAAMMRLLKLPSTTKGLSENSIFYLLGAIVVTSMAPGEIARTVEGGTAPLTFIPAKKTYEQDRNEMKASVESFRERLTDDEKSLADSQARLYLESTQGRGRRSRRIPSLRATSPERETGQVVANAVAGGGYRGPASLKPKKSLPTDNTLIPLAFTEKGRIPNSLQ